MAPGIGRDTIMNIGTRENDARELRYPARHRRETTWLEGDQEAARVGFVDPAERISVFTSALAREKNHSRFVKWLNPFHEERRPFHANLNVTPHVCSYERRDPQINGLARALGGDTIMKFKTRRADAGELRYRAWRCKEIAGRYEIEALLELAGELELLAERLDEEVPQDALILAGAGS